MSVLPVDRGGAMGLGLLEITGYRETQEPIAVTLQVKRKVIAPLTMAQPPSGWGLYHGGYSRRLEATAAGAWPSA